MAATYTLENHQELVGAGRRDHPQIDTDIDVLQDRVDQLEVGGSGYYEFAQNIPSTIWIINHGLPRAPAVVTVVVDGEVVICQVAIQRIAPYTVTLTFNVAVMGTAYLSL